MQQQIGIGRLLQSGLEGFNQAVRQIADEAHGVRQGDDAPGRPACFCAGPVRAAGLARARQIELARGGVQRGEKLVGSVGARLGQRIEQGGLARVGVAHERDGKRLAPLALAALRLALALDFGQALLGALDGLANHAAVQLNLRFAGAAARAYAALLALQVAPAAHQARGQVLQAGQLHLQLALVAAGALREDVQNDQRAVIDGQPDGLFQIALLHGRERLIEQHLLCAMLNGQHADFLGLAAAHEQGGIGRAPLAGDARHGVQARRGGQQAQLLQIGIEMRLAKVHAHQHGGWRRFSGAGGSEGRGV